MCSPPPRRFPPWGWKDGCSPASCRTDRFAPCRYYHLKLKALNGGRDKLTDEELEFVGVGTFQNWTVPDGWVQIGGLPVLAAADENDVGTSEFDAALAKAYHALGMVPPQSRLDFLGG